MPRPFIPLSIDEFVARVQSFGWRRRVWRVDMHHTWFPTHADYVGEETIEAMRKFHQDDLGWDDIAQHVSIAPDGLIWTGRDWNKMPASVGWGLNKGVFMFETIGNFDEGHDVLSGAQLEAVVTVIATIQRVFGLPAESLLFHREVPVTQKTCPGTSVRKSDILMRVRSKHDASLGALTNLTMLVND